jgi:hypothetical protein
MKPMSIYCGDVPDDFGNAAGEKNPAPETGTAARQLAFTVKLHNMWEIRKHPVVPTVLHFMERCVEVPGNFIHTIPTVYTNFTTAGTRTKIEEEK